MSDARRHERAQLLAGLGETLSAVALQLMNVLSRNSS